MLTGEVGPRSLIVPHTHAREDELSVVQQGRIGARVGDRDAVVEAGEFLFRPRGDALVKTRAGEYGTTRREAGVMRFVVYTDSGGNYRWRLIKASPPDVLGRPTGEEA